MAQIKPLQDQYKKEGSEIGKFRTKNEQVEQRNNFIYNSRHLTLKELSAQVKDRYNEDLDQGYIGKIRSREIKRRQNP